MSEIGQTLKNARVDKGLTLDDLQQTTKIQKRYLIAIEEENFDALPGDFYVRAFIREYAETVDLDAGELLASIDDQLGKHEEEPTETNETISRVNMREKNKDTEMGSGQKLLNYLPTIVIVVVVVAIIGTVFGVSYNNKRQAQKSVDNDVTVSSAASTSKTSAGQSSKSASNKSDQQSKNESSKKKAKKSKKTKQKISLSQNSGSNFVYTMENAPKTNKVSLKVSGGSAWNSVSVNGTQSWQGTLAEGEDHTVDIPADATSVAIHLGNSKATSIKINNKKFNFLKDNADLTVRTLTIKLSDPADQQSSNSEGNTNAQGQNGPSSQNSQTTTGTQNGQNTSSAPNTNTSVGNGTNQ